jgi:hypothetical protein
LSFEIKSIDHAIEKLEQDLTRVAKWCCENKLLINPDKTKFLLIGTRQLMQRLPNNMTLNFIGKRLTPAESAKDLGVILDHNLTNFSHVPMYILCT